MKKVFVLVGLCFISSVFALSLEEVGADWQKRYEAKEQEQFAKIQQNEEFQRLAPHCQAGDKGACKRAMNLYHKQCENGATYICAGGAMSYANGDEVMQIEIDTSKAQKYADKVCTMDAVPCASMSLLFKDKDSKLALKYAEKACEMGELVGCGLAFEFYSNGSNGIGKNPNKAKFYADKFCKAGISEFCER